MGITKALDMIYEGFVHRYLGRGVEGADRLFSNCMDNAIEILKREKLDDIDFLRGAAFLPPLKDVSDEDSRFAEASELLLEAIESKCEQDKDVERGVEEIASFVREFSAYELIDASSKTDKISFPMPDFLHYPFMMEGICLSMIRFIGTRDYGGDRERMAKELRALAAFVSAFERSYKDVSFGVLSEISRDPNKRMLAADTSVYLALVLHYYQRCSLVMASICFKSLDVNRNERANGRAADN